MKYRGTEPNCSSYVLYNPTAVTMYVRSLFVLLVLTVENVGAKVVVTFNPNWNKIFTGESLNMTCHVNSTVEDVTYQWFKDGYLIYSGKTFTISSAQVANNGNYQCQTSAGERSDSTRLEVHNGYVILQTSPYVYEGDNLTLRCHHHPGYLAKQTIFYKNNAVIKHWGPEDELHIENVDVNSNAKYKCTKQVNHHLLYYQHTDETSVSVQELFSLPAIRLSPYPMTEGDHMALTCHTILSPLRQATVLQFAFYRDGQKIKEFSLSNKYEIQSVKQHDAGDYNCEIKTSNYRIKKMSTMLTIQVNRNSQKELFNHSETEVMSKPGRSLFITAVSVTSLVLVLVIVGTGLIFLYRTKHFLPVNQSPKAEVEERDEETENIYTEADINNRWQNLSQKSNMNDLVKENHFILC